MIVKELRDAPDRVFALVLETGEKVIETLTAFAEERKLSAAHFTGIGASREATIAFFDPERREYEENPVGEQVEVASMVGNVALGPEGERKVHAHVALGRRDGTALAGHLVEATVRPTLEVFLTETPAELRREVDEATGLPLVR